MAGPRAPIFGRFIGTGAVLGALVGIWFANRGDAVPGYTDRATLGFLGLGGAFLGGLLAAIVAIVVDGRMARRDG